MDNYKLCLLHTLLTFTVRTINVLIASISTLTINHTQSSILYLASHLLQY